MNDHIESFECEKSTQYLPTIDARIHQENRERHISHELFAAAKVRPIEADKVLKSESIGATALQVIYT